MAGNDGVLGVAVFDVDHLSCQQFNIRSTEPGISDLCQDFVIPNLRLRDLGILDYSRIHEPNGFHQAVSFFLSRFV